MGRRRNVTVIQRGILQCTPGVPLIYRQTTLKLGAGSRRIVLTCCRYHVCSTKTSQPDGCEWRCQQHGSVGWWPSLRTIRCMITCCEPFGWRARFPLAQQINDCADGTDYSAARLVIYVRDTVRTGLARQVGRLSHAWAAGTLFVAKHAAKVKLLVQL